MTNNLISVIIPVYKVEKYLDRCVESVVNQTYKNLEIILVDDGSPDNCPTMCDEWAKKDNRIKVIHKENGGVSSARNVGLDNATGEYVSFVDSDDYLELNAYENMIQEYSKDVDLVQGNMILEYAKGKKTLTEKRVVDVNADTFFNYIVKSNVYSLCDKLYKKSKISFRFEQDMKYGEDGLFNFNYIKTCKKISYIPEVVYIYYENTDSATHQYNPVKYQNTIRIIKFLEEDFFDDLTKEQKILLTNYEMSSLFGHFRSVLELKTLTFAQKRKILTQYVNDEPFKKFEKTKKDAKRWIHYFLIKHKMILTLKFLYKFV